MILFYPLYSLNHTLAKFIINGIIISHSTDVGKKHSDEWIKELKKNYQHGPGTPEEVKVKLRKFSLYPKLYECLKP